MIGIHPVHRRRPTILIILSTTTASAEEVTLMSWYDDKPVYYDKSPGPIKLPHDPQLKDPDELAKLSGPVVTYNLRDREESSVNDRD